MRSELSSRFFRSVSFFFVRNMSSSLSHPSTGPASGYYIRHTTPALKAELRNKFEPYPITPVSIAMMSAQKDFHTRVDAYDKYVHLSHDYVGYLRSYEQRRHQITLICRELTEIERKMVATKKKMLAEAKSVLEHLPPAEDFADDTDSDDETKDDEEVTLVRSDRVLSQEF
jgi:hypothetical protein